MKRVWLFGRQPLAPGLVASVMLAVLLGACAAGASRPTLLPAGRTPQSGVATPVAVTEESTPSATVASADSDPVAAATATPLPSATAMTPVASATAPVPTAAVLRTRYTLLARLDYGGHRLDATEIVTYVNSTAVGLPDLLFLVEPNQTPGVFHLDGLRWPDGRAVSEYALDAGVLRVALPAPLAPGDQVGLHLTYSLDLPAQAAPLGYTQRQANLGDWYPWVPPYVPGAGWAAHTPAAVGEHLVYDVADYQVEIVLDPPEPGLAIAASGLVETNGDRYRYQLDAARSFSWSVSPDYVVQTQVVGDVMVSSYAFAEHRAAGEAALQVTARGIELYGRLFGGYPHAELTVAEVEFSDGMEYDGLYFLGQEYYASYAVDPPRGWFTIIAAHETAHAWWYGLVGNDQALEPWLDEALCAYSERLFFEAYYPDLVDWWWEFRIARYEPQGWVDSTIYEHTGFRPYVNAVYLRGAQFLHELRGLMGDEAFLSFIQDYVTRQRNKLATTNAFFGILREHTAVDLAGLIGTYFRPDQFELSGNAVP